MAEVALPASKRVFRKARQVIADKIKALNAQAVDKINFDDFKATVDKAGRTVTLSLVDEADKSKYKTPDAPVVFSYSADTLASLLQAAGFNQGYDISQKDALIQLIPDGLTNSWDESSKTLTISVAADTTEFDFKESNSTLVTALFQANETYAITFVDNRVDYDAVFTNKTLSFTGVDSFFEAEPTASV